MAKVTTKTEDTGLTRLLGKERMPKSDPRIALLGTIDEATSALGLARAYSSDARVREIVLHVQRDLYILMADVATPPQHRHAIGMPIAPKSVQWLEDVEAALLAEVEIPNTFIPLPLVSTRRTASSSNSVVKVRCCFAILPPLCSFYQLWRLYESGSISFPLLLADALFLTRPVSAGPVRP